MYFDFGNVLVFTILGLSLSAIHLALGRFLRPHNPEAKKLSTYECGEPPTGGAWINFNVRFYLIALVFLIFELEIVFMVPVMVVFRDWVLAGNGLYALVAILLFVGTLAEGLVYVWAKRDLEWLKRINRTEEEPRLPKAA
jgi:NADH-quinone oxidoreductase subunit A